MSGERWGRLASRYYRYGIRLSLRLARILAELGKTSKLLAGTSRYLLEFASTRTSILARDYNALLRELFQVLLLRASIARTKERIDVLLAKTHGPSGDHLTQQTIHAPYLDAFSYLHAAERRWLALGGAGALTRRLVFERINLGQTALWRIDEQVGQARQEKDEVVMLQTKALLACLDADLRVLSRFSESDDQQNVGFWKSLYNWHDHRQTELKEKLGWLSAELDS